MRWERLWQGLQIEWQQVFVASVWSCSEMEVCPWSVGCMWCWLLYWNLVPFLLPQKEGWLFLFGKLKETIRTATTTVVLHHLVWQARCLLIYYSWRFAANCLFCKDLSSLGSCLISQQLTLLVVWKLTKNQCEFWFRMLAAYVDLKQMFVSVHHEVLWDLLQLIAFLQELLVCCVDCEDSEMWMRSEAWCRAESLPCHFFNLVWTTEYLAWLWTESIMKHYWLWPCLSCWCSSGHWVAGGSDDALRYFKGRAFRTMFPGPWSR